MRRSLLRSVASSSLSSASSALRCASSWTRRFSPRWAVRTSTREPRRSGEKLGEAVCVADTGRDDEERRDARGTAVVLEAERLDEGLRVLAGDVLEREAVPIDEAPVAERKHLNGGDIAARRDADDVDGPEIPPVRRLTLCEMTDREQSVPVTGRLLERLALGRVLHLRLERLLDRLGLTGEKLDDAVDHLTVRLLGHVPDAGREAALDVVVEAWNAGVASGLRPLAGPVAEDPVEHVEGLPDLLRRRVRSEVDDAAPVPLTREHDARKIIPDGDRDVRIRLVVPEPDVERRSMPLDQVLLEVERLPFRLRDDDLDPLDPRDHSLEACPCVAAAEVRPDAGTQRLGFSHVQHLIALVPEQVDAGLRRQAVQLRLDALRAGFSGRRHSLPA